MSMEHMHQYVKTVTALDPVSVTSTAYTGAEVDSRGGFDRIQFVIQTGDIASTAGLTVKVQNSVTSGGTFADVTSAALTNLVSTDTGSVFLIDVPVSNTRPYYKLVGGSTNGAVVASAVANLYNGTRTMPPATTIYGQVKVV